MSTKVIKYISVCLLVLAFGAFGTGVAKATLTAAATALTSDGALTLTGAATSVWSLSTGALTINSANTSALTLDSGTTGAVNLGTGASAKTITIGNNTTSTGLVLTTGTGGLDFSSTAATADVLDIAAASLTTGDLFDIDAAAITEGDFFDITVPATRTSGTAILITDASATGVATAPLIDINVNSTATTNVLDITYATGVGPTGNAIDLNMGTNVAGNAIAIATAGTTLGRAIEIISTGTIVDSLVDVDMASGDWQGNIVEVTTGGTASDGNVFDITLEALDVAVQNMVVTNAAATTAVGWLMDIDTSAAWTGNAVDIDLGAGISTGNVLDITYATAAHTGNAIDLNMGTNLEGQAIDINLTGVRTDDGINIDDDSTGNTPVLDMNITGIRTGNAIDITYATLAATENAIDLNMGTNVAGMAISVSSAATGTSGEGSALDVLHTGALAAGADVVSIDTTGNISSTSNVLSVTQRTGAGTTGAYAMYISATGANVEGLKVDDGTSAFDEAVTVTTAAVGTAPFTVTGLDNQTAAVLDLNVNNVSGTLIDVDYAAETQTGDLTGLDLNLNTNVTSATDQDVTGVNVQTPALTATDTSVTTTYTGYNISAAGTLATTDGAVGAAVINWRGANITIPAITAATGDTVTATGILITEGTITNGAGTETSIAIDATDADIVTALSVGANEILGTTGAINLDFFDVAATTGAVTLTQQAAGTAPFTVTGIDNGTANILDLNVSNVSGTLIAVDYVAETQTGDLTGLSLNLNTNVTAATDQDVTGVNIQTPALTATDTLATTTYTGYNISAAGALDTATGDVAVATINWRGLNVTIPAIDSGSTLDVVTATGILISAGTVTDGLGTETSIAIDATDTDIVTALSIAANAIEATELDFNIAPTAGTSSIAVTASADAEDFLVDLIGGFNTSLTLRSAGNSTDALVLSTTAGGMDITVAGNLDTEDLDITATGATTEIRVATASTVADAFRLNASAGGIDIDATNSTLTISNTANGDGDDLTIEVLGAQTGTLALASAGTGADALTITTSAGGIDITVAGAAANEDIDITTNSSINLASTENVADAIYIRANAGTAETIRIHADQGTGYNSIQLLSDAGGIGIRSGIGVTVGGAANTVTTASNVTYTAAQLCAALLNRDPAGLARTDTTDTAANLVAACVPTIGDTHIMLLQNTADAAEAITIAAGVGVELLELDDASDFNVVIEQNNWAYITFTNVDGTVVVMTVAEASDAD